MPNNYENRVLVRRNARLVSAEEFQEIMEKGKAQMTQLPSMPFTLTFNNHSGPLIRHGGDRYLPNLILTRHGTQQFSLL